MQKQYRIKLGNQGDGDYKLVKMPNFIVYLLHVLFSYEQNGDICDPIVFIWLNTS